MHRILVCLDASSHSKGVLTAAIDLARRTGAGLLLFRAVGIPLELPHEAYAMPPDSLSELLEEQARKHLKEEAAAVPQELLAGVKIHVGTPWQAICDVAKEENVDLIVIGSHGYQGIDRLIGTTAAKVVNHADRSVLVVRAAELLTS